MSRADTNSVEHVLMLIAAMDPRPWYPRVYARDYNVSLDDLNASLLVLWNEGLLVKADSGSASTGAGLVLSLAGKRLLDNPTGLQRLNAARPRRSAGREQRPPSDDDDDRDMPEALPAGKGAEKFRASLSSAGRPIVTQTLLGLNFAVFFLGVALASQAGGDASSAFFMGTSNRAAMDALHTTGSVAVGDLVEGQWWRLLSSCFVHGSIIHIAMNMYVLYSCGRRGEQIWGWWRFLTIYLLAGVGGSVLAMTLRPTLAPTVGASGAICGILAGELIWVVLNGRYLPRDVAGGWMRSLIINAVIITIFSVMGDRVSWQGHLGGAIVGAVVAGILNVQRFAPSPWRWAALLLFLLLPLGTWERFHTARSESAVWLKAEESLQDKEAAKKRESKKPRTSEEEATEFQDLYLPRITAARKKADAIWKTAKPLLERHPTRRPPKEELDAIIASIDQSRAEMQKLADDLAKLGPYQFSKPAEEARVVGAEFLHAYAAFFEQVVSCLRDKVDPKDRPEFAERQNRLDKLRKQWLTLLE